MKIIITENQMMRAQFKYLDYLFDGMYEIKSNDYPNSKVWAKDGEIILELDDYNGFWVLREIWDNICDMFSIGYPEINELIKEWAEENLDLEGTTLNPNAINPVRFYTD
jgi:hypothetical protein